jgi:hypothetical protein
MEDSACQRGRVTSIDLHGYWSNAGLYMGSMEAKRVAFLQDGSGWSEWANLIGFEAVRFHWQVPETGVLTVHVQAYRNGTHSGGHYRVRDEHPEDETRTTEYAVTSGRDAVDREVTILQVQNSGVFGLRPESRYASVGREIPYANPWSAEEA